ncbi:hypothetical protein [Salinicoccus bachuensis]|uniref:Uncharacterized protein n=1 Tax=Salinicoccus bachuensis TaxID=3136731 RepID=A0ABZ3CEP8_9STAP
MNGKRDQFDDKEINWEDDANIYENDDEETIRKKKRTKRQSGEEGRYEANKRTGINGCLILTVAFIAILVFLGSCTGLFFGDEQDEEITEDQAPGTENEEVDDDSSHITPGQEIERLFEIHTAKATFPGGFHYAAMNI